MSSIPPRAVFVTRESDYELLLQRHGTRDQARFFLERRGQSLDELSERHLRFQDVLRGVREALPRGWRHAAVSRRDFDRFLFAPEDIIVAVGQDGLVANISKYLSGQPVVGVNPDPKLYDGVLVRFEPQALISLLPAVGAGQFQAEERTMAAACFADGTQLTALNEVFIGHRSHQSARYEILAEGRRETQSSSGVIVATGSGATGWASSIMAATRVEIPLAPTDAALGFFVREAFSSVATGTEIRCGRLEGSESLTLVSRMNEGGTVFADGIEQHYVPFNWGEEVEVRQAATHLKLVLP